MSILFSEENMKLLENANRGYHVVTNGKGGLYRWMHDTLPEKLHKDEEWAWVQRHPINPQFQALARWNLTQPSVPESWKPID